MLSIGEIAHAAGVSRRMLRHWESIGLIAPAEVDEFSGYRRYAVTQVGRARAIAALRAVGFGLETIEVLLGPELKQQRLVELLRAREGELLAEIDTASARLREVRSRLVALQEGNATMQNICLGPLNPLRLVGLQSRVTDESEIGTAVSALLPRIRQREGQLMGADAGIVFTYDGTAEEEFVVSVGTLSPAMLEDELLHVIGIPGAEHGVTVSFDAPPASAADMWMVLDSTLEKEGLITTNIYRQLLDADGTTTFQAPVRSREPS
ncbi:MerR family transcriptional regulator [Arthrobacter echini]|nr:MerR family transcriptional regulator [Arthrobacter echini]